jgi:hypothetical protein
LHTSFGRRVSWKLAPRSELHHDPVRLPVRGRLLRHRRGSEIAAALFAATGGDANEQRGQDGTPNDSLHDVSPR